MAGRIFQQKRQTSSHAEVVLKWPHFSGFLLRPYPALNVPRFVEKIILGEFYFAKVKHDRLLSGYMCYDVFRNQCEKLFRNVKNIKQEQ